MNEIDPLRTDLAHEFKTKPYGPHSPDLQKVLSIMRWKETPGKYVLVETPWTNHWALGRLPARRGEPVELYDQHIFTRHEEGLWHLFKIRWEEHTGQRLEAE
jgi:hypothetical protein